MNLWGYELKEKDANQNPTITPEPQMIESFDLFNMPTRRGRKPTFPLERWIPIAMKWENRDPIRNAFTLGELIAEHLGTNTNFRVSRHNTAKVDHPRVASSSDG